MLTIAAARTRRAWLAGTELGNHSRQALGIKWGPHSRDSQFHIYCDVFIQFGSTGASLISYSVLPSFSFTRAFRGCGTDYIASWKRQKKAPLGNFGTRPPHPNIIWHSIKGRGERIRREGKGKGEEAHRPPTTLSVSVSRPSSERGASCQLLFGAVGGRAGNKAIAIDGSRDGDGALGGGVQLSPSSRSFICTCRATRRTHAFLNRSVCFGIRFDFASSFFIGDSPW